MPDEEQSAEERAGDALFEAIARKAPDAPIDELGVLAQIYSLLTSESPTPEPEKMNWSTESTTMLPLDDGCYGLEDRGGVGFTPRRRLR